MHWSGVEHSELRKSAESFSRLGFEPPYMISSLSTDSSVSGRTKSPEIPNIYHVRHISQDIPQINSPDPPTNPMRLIIFFLFHR